MLATGSLRAFDPITDDSDVYVVVWERGTIPMVNNLPNAPTLSDGTTFRGSADAALARWNEVVGNVQFAGSHGSEGAYENGNAVNELALDDTIGDYEFGDYTLAVTLSFTDGDNTRVESDVIFNDRWNWDSYRGDLRAEDEVRRVAIHELGHVLGLAHPDEAAPPQAVQAIMNSLVSDIDDLQPDDIAGAQFLYGAPHAPPLNDDFADAIEIELGAAEQVSVTGTNIQGTAEPGEPALDPEGPGPRSVWWRWTASDRVPVRLTTLGSRFDTILGVFVGEAVADLTEVAVNDDVDPGIIRSSAVEFVAEPGVTYRIVVDGWDGYEGAIQLNLRRLEPPRPTVAINAARIRPALGDDVALTVAASPGFDGVLSYQWFRDNRPLAGATGTDLVLEHFANGDAGAYTVRVTETGGSVAHVTAFVLPSYHHTAVVAWGSETIGADLSGLTELDDAIAVAAGDDHALVLRADGTVVGWSTGGEASGSGAAAPPAGLTDVVAIAAAGNHSLALRADGSVAAWGSGPFGGPAVVPPGLENVIAIKAGYRHSAALRADGSVVVWRVADDRAETLSTEGGLAELGLDDLTVFTIDLDGRLARWVGDSLQAITVPQLPAGRGLSVGADHALLLGADGRVHAVPAWDGNVELAPDEGVDFARVEASAAGQSFGVTTGGDLVGWGPGGAVASSLLARMPSGLDQVLAVETGSSRLALALRHEAVTQPPSIRRQPAPVEAVAGDEVFLSVEVGGHDPFRFTWRRDGVVVENSERVAGATGPRLRLRQVRAEDAGDYTVEVVNAAGAVVSDAATITVLAPARFEVRPLTRLALEGDTVTLNAVATGTGTLSYQWWHDSEPIAGATSASLTLTDLALADGGRYTLRVRDGRSEVWTQCWLHVGATDAEVVRWIADGNPQPIPLPGTEVPAVRLDVGRFGVWLGADGRVRDWSEDSGIDAEAFAGLSDVVDVAAGDLFALALRADGTVVLAGNDGFGDLAVPTGLTEVVAVRAGEDAAAAIRADGSVVVWGRDQTWQVPSLLTDVVDVSLDQHYGLLLHRDGALSSLQPSQPVPGGIGPVRLMAAGGLPVVVQGDGAARSWGDWNNGQAEVLAALVDVRALDQGERGGGALLADGSVVTWTSQGLGSILSPTDLAAAPILDFAVGSVWAGMVRGTVPGIASVAASANPMAGDDLFLSVQTTGSAAYAYRWYRDGVALQLDDRVSIGADGTLRIRGATTADSGVYTVRVANAAGAVVSSGVTVGVLPRPVMIRPPVSRTVFWGEAVELDATATDPGVSYQWFFDGAEIAGATGSVFTIAEMEPAQVGRYGVKLVGTDGGELWHQVKIDAVAPGLGVMAWGYSGEAFKRLPQAAGLTDVVDFEPRGLFPLALRRDGGVVQLSDRSLALQAPPAGLGEVVKLAGGGGHMLALTADGEVVAWGDNAAGQTDVPAGLTRVVDIAAGPEVSVAIQGDGRMVVWGAPAEVAAVPEDLTGVVAVRLGEYGAALQDDGTLRTWRDGALAASFDIRPDGLTDVAAISGDGYVLVALLEDGSAMRWTRSFDSFPPPPSPTSPWVAISAGRSHGLALTSEGQLVGWGDNQSGQLSIPAAAAGAERFWAYGANSYALVPATGLAIAGHPVGVRTNLGGAAEFRVEVGAEAGPLLYQWMRDGVPLVDDGRIAGTDTPVLRLADVTGFDAAGYDVRVGSGDREVVSGRAQLEVVVTGVVPVFVERPRSARIRTGETVVLRAEAEGAVHYRWRHRGHILADSDSAEWVIEAATLRDGGRYTVEALSAGGRIARSICFLNVVPADLTVQLLHEPDYALDGLPTEPGALTLIRSTHGDLVGITAGGRLRMWGSNLNGELEVPAGLDGVVDVAHFGGFTAALLDDGTLASFGPGATYYAGLSAVSDAVALVPGSNYLLVIHADETVSFFRADGNGGLVVSTPGVIDTSKLQPPEGLSGVVGLSALSSSVYALLQDGSVVTWATTQPGVLRTSRYLERYLEFQVGDGAALAVDDRGGTYVFDGRGQTYDWQMRPGDLMTSWIEDRTITLIDRFGRAEVQGNDAAAVQSMLDQVTNLRGVSGRSDRLVATTSAAGPQIGSLPTATGVLPGSGLTLAVDVTGTGSLQYQWQKDGVDLHDDANVTGARTATLNLQIVGETDLGAYVLWVADDLGSSRTPVDALVVHEVHAPVITTPPQGGVVAVGESFSLSVVAQGTAPMSYQWWRNGEALAGADEASLIFNSAALADAGSYRVVITNVAGTMQSDPVFLSVRPAGFAATATHVVSPERYTPGGLVTVRAELELGASASRVTWSTVLPTGWNLEALADAAPAASAAPSPGDGDLLEWSWAALDGGAVTIDYTLRVPVDQRGAVELAELVEVVADGASVWLLAEPDPMVITAAFHSADSDGDFRLSLSELLRVIELYNTRAGTTRTGRYRLAGATEDGFAPDDRAEGEGAAPTRFHSADVDHDARLSLSELLRVIELYNTRAGTTRTGGYRIEAGTEDGFAPDR